MIDENISRLVVVENGDVLGVLTEKDTAKILFEFKKSTDRRQYARVRNIPVEDVMTKNVFTLSSSSTAGEASKNMLDKRFSGIPIVDEGKLAG
ncbi:MAG: CBS domain-containing protein, partial [Thiohalomonadales bacterium]